MTISKLSLGRLALFVFFLSYAPLVSQANTKLPLTPEKILELVGIDIQYKNLSEAMLQSFKTNPAIMSAPPKQKNAILDATRNSFDHKILLAQIAERMKGMLTLDEQKQLLAFLNTPHGRRIVAEEKARQTAFEQIKARTEGPKILATLQAKNAKRLEHYKTIDKIIGATETAKVLASHVAKISMRAMAAGSGQKMSEEDMDTILGRMNIQGIAADAVLHQLVYTYNNVSEDDLVKYIAFLKTPMARKFNKAMTIIQFEVLSKAFTDYGNKISALLKREKI